MNDILAQLHSSRRVTSQDEINSALFVQLFEGLCGETLDGTFFILGNICPTLISLYPVWMGFYNSVMLYYIHGNSWNYLIVISIDIET